MRIRAAVADDPARPMTISPIELDAPREHEILVRILASGICHTDLTAASGRLPITMPIVLGHEGAGVVEAIGARVTAVSPGDRVLLVPDFCGKCRECRTGHTTYCERMSEMVFGGTRLDGSTKATRGSEPVRAGFFGQSSFAQFALATERNIVPLESDAPIEQLAALTCGVSTGAGAVLNTLHPRPSDALTVFGIGTVGLAAIMAAKMIGVRDIVAVDQHANRLELAQRVGASMTVDTTKADPREAIRSRFSHGVARCLDTTGVPSLIAVAIDVLGTRGVCGFVAGTGKHLELDLGPMLAKGASLRGIMGGDATGLVFIHELLDAYEAGHLPLAEIVTTYPFEQINTAFEDMRSGESIKPVLVFPHAGDHDAALA